MAGISTEVTAPHQDCTIIHPSHRVTCDICNRCPHQPASSPINITDSGYASLASTPESNEAQKPEGCLDNNIFIGRRRKLFQRAPTILKQLDTELPAVITDRFDDLCELFERPLYDYLNRTETKYRSVAMRLKVLGESEALARPWIIILCDAVIMKKAKQFFQLRWVKEEYQPNTAENNLPYFEIHYIGRAPKQRAATAYFDLHKQSFPNSRASETLCGRAIKVMGTHGDRTATLGGVIAIKTSQGDIQLYGMTVGHVLSAPPASEDEPCTAPRSSELEDEDGDEDEDDIYIEGLTQLDPEFEDSIDADCEGLFAYEPDSTEPPHLSQKLGNVYASSCSAEDRACNLDWTLITIEDLYQYLPNQFTDATRVHAVSNRISPHTQERAPPRRAVVQLSDASLPRQGYLSLARPTYVMLSPAKTFTKVYTLSLSDGSGLKPGECGSWIVDSTTDELYGHITASDAFGDAYVVPINATLASMKQHLAATVAFLPSAHEVQVARWTASELHRCPEYTQYKEVASNSKVATFEVRPLEHPEKSEQLGDYTVLRQTDGSTASKPMEDVMFPGETDHLVTPSQTEDPTTPEQMENFVNLRKSLYDLAQGPRSASGNTESPPQFLCHPYYKKFKYFADAATETSVTLRPGTHLVKPNTLQMKEISVPEQLRELSPDSGYSSAPPTPDEDEMEQP